MLFFLRMILKNDTNFLKYIHDITICRNDTIEYIQFYISSNLNKLRTKNCTDVRSIKAIKFPVHLLASRRQITDKLDLVGFSVVIAYG